MDQGRNNDVLTSQENPSERADLKLTAMQIEVIGRELGEPGWLVDRRQKALKGYLQFQSAALQEKSSRRDISKFPRSEMGLEILAPSGRPKHIPGSLLRAMGEDLSGHIIFEDGESRAQSLEESAQKVGVILAPIAAAAKQHPDLLKTWLGSTISPEDGKFAALASAVYDAGLFIYIPAGVRLEKPLHSIIWTSGSGIRAWRLNVVVEEGASLSLINECVSADGRQKALRTGIVEISVMRGGTLQFLEHQSWAGNVGEMSHKRAVLHQESTIHWVIAHQGAGSSKTYSGMDLKGEGANGKWTGMYFLTGDQRADISTQQRHLAPRTTSDLLCKGAVAGSSRSRWQGMVYVAPGAVQSDGYQINRNLMLSPDARAESLPGLEILADDIRCSHGVSIGEVDAEESFYAMSRGISSGGARSMLVGGFFEPALERIPVENWRRRVRLTLNEKIGVMDSQIKEKHSEPHVTSGDLERTNDILYS